MTHALPSRPGLQSGRDAVRERMLSGNAGRDRTVALVWRGIEEGGKSPDARQLACKIIWGIGATDYRGQINALYRWGVQQVLARYGLDPVDVELVRGFKEAIRNRVQRLDCDDFDVLMGSLAQSIGHKVRVRTLDLRKGRPGPASDHHTDLEVFDRSSGTWIPFDVCLALIDSDAQAGDALPFKSKTTFASAGQQTTQSDGSGQATGGKVLLFAPKMTKVTSKAPVAQTFISRPVATRGTAQSGNTLAPGQLLTQPGPTPAPAPGTLAPGQQLQPQTPPATSGATVTTSTAWTPLEVGAAVVGGGTALTLLILLIRGRR